MKASFKQWKKWVKDNLKSDTRDGQTNIFIAEFTDEMDFWFCKSVEEAKYIWLTNYTGASSAEYEMLMLVEIKNGKFIVIKYEIFPEKPMFRGERN